VILKDLLDVLSSLPTGSTLMKFMTRFLNSCLGQIKLNASSRKTA